MTKKGWFVDIDYDADPETDVTEASGRLKDYLDNAEGRIIHKGSRILFSNIGDAMAVRMDMDRIVTAAGTSRIQ